MNLMIIGAQKSGTTSILNYLKEHPALVGHFPVEFTFFADITEYQKGFASALKNYFPAEAGDTIKKLVGKNVAIALREDALKRLKEHNSDCKLVWIIRDPVTRAYSAHTMAVRDGWMNKSFRTINSLLKDQSFKDVMYTQFVRQGVYADQLSVILKYFEPKNIKIYLYEDIKQFAGAMCEDIFNWLEVDPHFSPNLAKRYHSTTLPRSKTVGKLLIYLRQLHLIKRAIRMIIPYSWFSWLGSLMLKANRSGKNFEEIPEDTKMVLAQYYQEHNERLRMLLTGSVLKGCLKTFGNSNWLFPENRR